MELLVVLVIMGILMSLSTVVISRHQALAANTATRVAAAQLESAASGRTIRLEDDSGRALLMLPDGSVLGPGFDPLTGGPRAAR
jgi:type II secretory pathway pseudopilin PulG